MANPLLVNLSRLLSFDSALGKLLRLPLRLLPKNSVVKIKTGKLRNKRWLVGSGVHGYWIGTYEWEKQQFFSQHLKPGMVVYDIGAHVGFYSLLSSSLVGEGGKVYAFEPNPRNQSYLRNHLEMNTVTNVDVLNDALTDAVGFAFFDTTQDSFQGHLMENGVLKVPTQTLDNLLSEETIRPAQVVKIDAEGAEVHILRGGAIFFQQHHPLILLATHSQEIHRESLKLLKTWRYQVTPLRKDDSLETASEIIAAFSESSLPR